MNKQWKLIAQNAIGFGILGAALFATIFAVLSLSPNTIEDLVFGTIVGALSGMIVAVVVGVIAQELIAQKKKADLLGWSISNAIIGAFTGAIVTTFVIIVMVSLMGFPGHSSNLVFWSLFLGRLVGTAVGTVMGLTIGASWNWLQLRIVT